MVMSRVLYYFTSLAGFLLAGVSNAKECSCEVDVFVKRAAGPLEYVDASIGEPGGIPVVALETGDTVLVYVEFLLWYCMNPVVLRSFNNIPLAPTPPSWPPWKVTSPGYYYFDGDADGLIFKYPAAFIIGAAPVSSLALKVLLGGAMDVGTTEMRSDLVDLDILSPLTTFQAPGGMWSISDLENFEPISQAVLVATGQDRIVDWVRIEFRDPLDPSEVQFIKYALVQEDGDVIERNGTWPLTVILEYGDYHIAIRHRNHLGAMTSTAITLNADTAFIDFTDPGLETYGTDARKPVGDLMALWPGNARMYGNYQVCVKYTGTSNDRDLILQRIGGSVPTATASGYFVEDLNLDGIVKYTGANNDSDVILQTIGGSLPTAVRQEQLPY